jgi:purine-nucleoside phosphorylase
MDTTFKILFGTEADAIQKTCVIMPFNIPKAAEQLGASSMVQGRLFSCGQGKGFTLIRSGMSAGFVGDCVLWLKDTPCQNIFFLGTCGLLQPTGKLDIGSVVTPATIHAFESFSNIVSGKMSTPMPITADQSLIELMNLGIPKVGCISFASLHEETQHISLFKQLGAQVIEMECAAFFTAAKKIHRRASALLIASDIVGDANFCFKLSSENKTSLANGVSQACKIIRNF